MQEDKLITKCPTCDKPIEWSSEYPYRPFCSKRCRLIDLGEWLDESHRIPGQDTGSGTQD